MRLLLDTHTLLWWLSDDRRLGSYTRSAISDPANTVLVSVVSLWEIVVKRRVGKLRVDIADLEAALARDRFGRLGILADHLATLETLPLNHRDPFDHLLLAQALCEKALFVSEDKSVINYGVELLRCSATEHV